MHISIFVYAVLTKCKASLPDRASCASKNVLRPPFT